MKTFEQNEDIFLILPTVEVKTLHTPFRISKMLIILPKSEGSYKMHVIVYLEPT